MTGKNCVAIATDMRFGVRGQTVAMDFPKIFKITDQCYVGLPGLISDTQTVLEQLRFRTKLYKLREEREMKPSVFSKMVSSLLYSKRYVHPCIHVCLIATHTHSLSH
jgi:20S proteasome subunit beta 3